jgi:hypothetical protein
MSTILEGYLPVAEFAKAIGKSKRTVERMIAAREVAFTYNGKTPLVNAPKYRAQLEAREIKPVLRRK